MGRTTATAVVATAGLVVAGLATSVPADAATAYDAVLTASLAKVATDGGATLACAFSDGSARTIRYSANLDRFVITARSTSGVLRTIGNTSALVYFRIPDGPVNALDTSFQRAAGRAAAALAHTSGAPVWLTMPQFQGGPQDSLWTSDSLASLLVGGYGDVGTPVPTALDATHWHTNGGALADAEITTAGGVVVAIKDGPNGDGTYGKNARCTMAYGPAILPSLTATSVSANQWRRTGLPESLVVAVAKLTRIRADAAKYLTQSRAASPIRAAAGRILIYTRARLGAAWTTSRLTTTRTSYVVTVRNTATGATLTWVLSRASYRSRHAARAVVALHVARVTVSTTSRVTP